MPKGYELVEIARVRRGPVVESVHHGVVVVADTAGTLRHAWGDPGFAAPARSALKPFLATALVESGAADELGLTDEHIALACASHQGQPFQMAALGDWLERLGMPEEALSCPPALPRDMADMNAAFAAGGPRRLYNDCAGKHLAALSIARRLEAGPGYADPSHPAQRLYRDILTEFLGRDASTLMWVQDGCGMPTPAVPLGAMARAVARFSVAQAVTPERRAAVRRVIGAMLAHPDHLAGKDEQVARLIRFTDGNIVAKGGEGYLLAGVRDRAIGIAIKTADGTERGQWGTLARILGRIGALPVEQAELLVEALEPPLNDDQGREVGSVEITLQKPEPTTPTRASLGFWMSGVPGSELLEFFEQPARR